MHRLALLVPIVLLAASPARGADEPPPGWHGSLGAGLSITGGNTDTKSYNLAFDIKYDPRTNNIVKGDAFYLRSEANGDTTADRLTFGVRDEYKLSERAFAFGEVRYLRDTFKDITFLISPIVGAGYHVVKTKEVTLSFDAGVGGAFEKDTGFDARSSLAFHLGQAFSWQIGEGSKLMEAATGLWKANDTQDALYHFEIGLATTIAKGFELKVTFNDDYKNRPSDPKLKKNDTALIAALILKF